MGNFPEILSWLTVTRTQANGGRYEHVLAKETDGVRAALIPRIREVVSRAHDDARKRLRRLLADSLDPLNDGVRPDPAAGYPGRLHPVTLKGYFGEFMAGAVAENLHPFNYDDWVVPAHLFRFHLVEFQHLEMMRQTGEEANQRPGRTGDDCLAFRRDRAGLVVASLFCEGKCTPEHRTSMIREAHVKASLPNRVPVDLAQLIEVLQDSDDPAAEGWVVSLRKLYFNKTAPGYERFDQITYACGQHPAQTHRTTWIAIDQPHADYTANRRLHVAEIHLSDVEGLIVDVYREDGTHASAR